MTTKPETSNEDEQAQAPAADHEAPPAPLTETAHPDPPEPDTSSAVTRRRDTLRKEIRAGWERALRH